MNPSLTDFDYRLPHDLIAQHPARERSLSRLLIYERGSNRIEDARFTDLGMSLKPGDVLVFNDSKVIRARLFGRKHPTGGKVEFLWLGEPERGMWKGLLRGSVGPGAVIHFGAGALAAKVHTKNTDGTLLLSVGPGIDALSFLDRFGTVPLPPYIKRNGSDRDDLDGERYQTVLAAHPGSVAAPTAGLHFDAALLERLKKMGIETIMVTLHVGWGTFAPMKGGSIPGQLHPEHYEISPSACESINSALASSRRVIVVGTTTARALESSADEQGKVSPARCSTTLFIRPGYRFKIVTNLLTNFHLPRSSLLMMVCALAGTAETLALYQYAVKKRYRFYSYGDAMLLLQS